MAAPDNPFAVPTPAMPPSPAGGNPFDPMGSSSPAPAAASPYQGAPAPTMAPNVQQYQGSPAVGMTQHPFQPHGQPQAYDSSAGMGGIPGTPQGSYPANQHLGGPGPGFLIPSPDMNTQQFYGSQQPTYPPAPSPNPPQLNQFGQQPVPPATPEQLQVGYPSPAPSAGYDPFAASPQVAAPAPLGNDAGAMVVSQQQSNPYDPFSVPHSQQPPAQAHPNDAGGAMVMSHQQSNPYGMVASPGPTTHQEGYAQYQGAPPPQQQWGMPPMPPAPVPPPGSGTLFDPMAPPPAQPPVAPAAPPPMASQENSLIPVAPGESFAPAEAPAPPPAAQPIHNEQLQPVAHHNSQPPEHTESRALATTEGNRPYGGGVGNNDNALVPARKPKPPAEGRNKYSEQLARRAPPGASPLPKADLVRKSGYVLSRISFRTIVMKKWKQSFWVQYGSHTMLWFRSQYDFDDWLNNPYHTQGQRNFLIKLAVNFVHDLYKPNVRGYQVTQCRSKPYGTKMVRQFKLERWMDYGPTIAAAFGSYDPKEVDALREAIVECMRNTPLDGGIRATGAVRQQPNQGGQPPRRVGKNDFVDAESEIIWSTCACCFGM